MCKKKLKKNGITKPKLDLETVMARFSERCEKCGEPLSAHAYRCRTNTKKEAVYASCTNVGKCGRTHIEICFLAGGFF